MKNVITLNIMFLILFSAQLSAAKSIIAVIDSGFDFSKSSKVKLCESGHKDFTGYGLHDVHGHGTNVAGLIDKYAKGDYCLLIIKYFHDKGTLNLNTSKTSTQAINYAILMEASLINYSGGGNSIISSEKAAVVKALDKGIVFVAAAGNEGKDLKWFNFYPAEYDNRIIVVGNLDGTQIASSSNRGTVVDVYENGVQRTALGVTLTGTSQATAVFTGKYVNFWEKIKKAIRKGLIK